MDRNCGKFGVCLCDMAGTQLQKLVRQGGEWGLKIRGLVSSIEVHLEGEPFNMLFYLNFLKL